jgi:DHA3 family macrolide efflux protein-like MFS transporter
MVDADIQGRVFGVMQLITNTVMPVGMLVFGPLADLVSIEALLVITSAFMVLPGIWLYFNKTLVTPSPTQPPGDYDLQPGD